MQRFPSLCETLLWVSFVVGWQSARSVARRRRRLARCGCARNIGQPDYLLPERVHMVVQFCVVAVARMATASGLDGIEWYYADVGTGAGIGVVAGVRRVGNDEGGD